MLHTSRSCASQLSQLLAARHTLSDDWGANSTLSEEVLTRSERLSQQPTKEAGTERDMTQQMQPSAVDGLFNHPKTLPTWLLYDDAGSQIYTRITGLPEYYLTRAEAEIFAQQGERIVERALAGAGEVSIVELGAGSSEKTELFLRAVVRAHGNFVHLACDIERGALELGVARLREAFPQSDVRGFVGTHEAAGAAIAELAGRQLVLFIGSSIGNLSDEQATAMLSALRARLRSDGGLPSFRESRLVHLDRVKVAEIMTSEVTTCTPETFEISSPGISFQAVDLPGLSQISRRFSTVQVLLSK